MNLPLGNDDEEDMMGEFADGKASAQRQITALQADLTDKNRYIATLERRLLQARRSSHSRMSMGMKTGSSSENPDLVAQLREKDMEINELRVQLDDKDRMLTALRSAARHRDLAQLTMDTPPSGPKEKSSSPNGERESPAPDSAANRLTPPAELDPGTKRKSMDEVSRILDEMIQDRVESGHLIKGSRGSVRVAPESRPTSESNQPCITIGPTNAAQSNNRLDTT